jgi:hypothetical protein
MARAEMIQACVNSTEDWDIDTLVAYTREVMEDGFKQLDSKTLIEQSWLMADEDFDEALEE